MIRHTTAFPYGDLRYLITMNVDGDRAEIESVRTERLAPVGLGDRVAQATSAVGIQPCGGCKRRQAWLNRLGDAIRLAVLIAMEPLRGWRVRLASLLSRLGRSGERPIP